MLSKIWEDVNEFYNERIHFIQLHYLYILLLSLLSSIMLYIQSDKQWDYIDALFMATSAVTNTGLNTVAISSLSTAQLLVIYVSSFLSSHIMISIGVVTVRKHYFSKRFEDILLFNKTQQMREANQRKFERNVQEMSRLARAGKPLRKRLSFLSVRSQPKQEQEQLSIGFKSMISLSASFTIIKKRFSNSDGVLCQMPNRRFPEEDELSQKGDSTIQSASDQSTRQETQKEVEKKDDSLQCTPDSSVHLSVEESYRNSNPQNIMFACNIEQQREIARRQFEKGKRLEDMPPGPSTKEAVIELENDEVVPREPTQKSELTRQQRYRLGGAEYRALDLLSRLVPACYFFFLFGFGFIIRAYIAMSPFVQDLLKNGRSVINPWHFSFFTSLSAFNNLGLSQVDESMEPFRQEPVMLTLVMILVLAGNTAYAILLRLVIHVLYKLTPHSFGMRRETLRYVLDHPRRCYTTLFPSAQTRWLLVVLVGITLIEFICFMALNYWLPVLEKMDIGTCILAGLFQSVSTRSGKIQNTCNNGFCLL